MDRDRSDWTLILLVFAGGLLAAAQFGKISLTLADSALAFERPITDLALMVSLVGVMGLTLGPMAGGIVAALGPGRCFLGGLMLGGAVSLGQAVLPPFGLFAISRGVEGIAHLALVVAGPTLMAGAASDRDRPVVMGLWAVFFGASLALSGQIFPGLIAAGGIGAVFAAHGAALLVLAAALWGRVPLVRALRPSLNPLAVHREIYGRIRTMAPGLGFVCYTFLFVAGVAVMPDALGRPGLATVLPLITLASTLAGGALCRRLPPHGVAAMGYAGTALGAGGLALGVPGAVEACFLFMGLIPGACFAAIPAWNPDPRDRARATGAIAQLGNLGTVTGTPTLVWAYAAGGLDALIGMIAGAALLGGVLAVGAGLRVTRSSGEPTPESTSPGA